MKPQDRKAAITAWKERKPAPAGIFSLTCTADGSVWVGESRNLEAQQNSLWFSLRLGSHLNRKAQAAYNAHGREAFVYAECERLAEEDNTGTLQHALLRDKAAEWRVRLGAATL
ncbi:MAG: GIY-YIG nuclease family protein [Micropepsaceae bacterium]